MAPVAKRNHIMTPKQSEQGQISIFFSASLVVFVSIIAFVINVGLFVKAKINLQNATDASAWAGAAVQARQLTKIAYLNWEMRNIYKEWMYKYYVVGNLNSPGVEGDSSNPCESGIGTCSNFRLATATNAITGVTSHDPFNIPATCIHIADSNTNVCRASEVPGLPEFGGYNIPGAEEASRAFIDSLIGTKLADCGERSRLNMLVNITWAYNVLSSNMDETLTGRAPAILTDRQGAWPRAVELALRIRNLEKVVNRVAEPKAVCIGVTGDCRAIDELTSENKMGNERIVKAFFSGYRNLGNHIDNEMKNSFNLTELPPTLPGKENQYSSSSLLIPNEKIYQKQYLDLKLMMVNYATFFAALIGSADKGSSAGCGISKVAIPVPGYPLGFYKNPDVLTYYAVKGEAEFEGMFNPFSTDGIKLTAYAAAKPMGGRIGPMLFTQKPQEQAIRSRQDPNKFRSVPYLSSLDIVGAKTRKSPDGLAEGAYALGAPLPINLTKPFWLKDVDGPVGGLASGDDIQFGIPNLVYDFKDGDMSSLSYAPAAAQLFTVTPRKSTPQNPGGGDQPVGLYSHEQFLKFKGSISGVITPEELTDHLARVRAPTLYEAANYLIPTPNELNANLKVDSFGFIPTAGTPTNTFPAVKRYFTNIYAPLYRGTTDQNDLLYETSDEVFKSIVDFMRIQKPAIQNYVRSLNHAAHQIYQAGVNEASAAATGAVPAYKKAGEIISDIDVTNGGLAYLEGALPKSCASLSGQFLYFYLGDPDLDPGIVQDQSTCPIPLATLLRQYFSASANDPNYSPSHYKMEYSYNPENFPDAKRIFSAYMPGPFNGASSEGSLVPPFSGQQAELMRRNFYSTKLVTLDSVQASGKYGETNGNFVIYSEGDLTTFQGLDRSQNSFANPLDTSSTGDDLSAIKY